jgi:hypothetical protein
MRAAIVCFAALLLTAGAAAAQSQTAITLSQRVVTARDRFEVTVTGSTDCGSTERGEPRVDGVTRRITLPVSINFTCDPPIGRNFSETFSLGPLAPGTWTLEAVFNEQEPAAAIRTLDVEYAEQRLHLHGLLFSVVVEWFTPGSPLRGEAYAVPTSDEGGYFWFFDATNPEVYVKILDGTAINGHWWVFISSNTNLRFRVHVSYLQILEPPFGIGKTYNSPAGANRNFIDTTFFAPAPTEP